MSNSEASLSKSTNKSMSLSKVSSPRATDPKPRMQSLDAAGEAR